MSVAPSDVLLREKTKRVLTLIQNEDLEAAKCLILEDPAILNYSLGPVNFQTLIPSVRFSKTIPKNFNALKMLIDTAYDIYVAADNTDELLFYAAAKAEPEKLLYCLEKLTSSREINQTKEGDTVLTYIIKFGNVAYNNFPKCVEILIEHGVDVNRANYLNQTPIILLVNLYDIYGKQKRINDKVSGHLRQVVSLLMGVRNIDITSHRIRGQTAQQLIELYNLYDLSNRQVEFKALDTNKDLFNLLINRKEQEFVERLGAQNCDIDDGNNTLLQLACVKKLPKAVKLLVQNGADVTKTTLRNSKPPIRIAAERNCPEIFDELLNYVAVNRDIFLSFLRDKGRIIKTRYFDELLKCKNIDVTIRSSNGNTPLHYAAIFSNSEAVSVLLDKQASLTVTNDSKKTPLDYLNADDLELYFTKNLNLDNHYDLHDGNYEVAMNFASLIDDDSGNLKSELEVASNISNSSKLKHLMNHPLMSTYLEIKWQLVESFYKKLLTFQLFFYFAVMLSFSNTPSLLDLTRPVLAAIYAFRVLAFSEWKSNKLHELVDFFIAALTFLSYQYYQLGFLLIIFMPISCYLYWRFSPSFSNFHASLMNLFSHLSSYLSCVLFLVLFLTTSSFVLFAIQGETRTIKIYDHDILFTNLHKNIQIYFVIMGIFITLLITLSTLILIHCFKFLQENFSDGIRNNFRISGYAYVIIFMMQVEHFYISVTNTFRLICRKCNIYDSPVTNLIETVAEFCSKFLRSPLIFDTSNHTATPTKKTKRHQSKRKRNKYMVNFYVNKNSFLSDRLLGIKLGEVNMTKIQKFINSAK